MPTSEGDLAGFDPSPEDAVSFVPDGTGCQPVEERCDGVDNDCDGQIDEDGAIDAPEWVVDLDGDGYGGDDAVLACSRPLLAMDVAGDCDDTRADVNAGAMERCDGIDNNCDGWTDTGTLCGDDGECRQGMCVDITSGFVRIAPGSFAMGSPPDEPGRFENEPVHGVTLTRSFAMKATEVTQAEWRAVMGSNPSFDPECGADCPVNGVMWDDAVEYSLRTSARDGFGACYDEAHRFLGLNCTGYRLPTEAERQYATRAGTTTPYYGGSTDLDLARIAWYFGNSGSRSHPVAQREPNAWGLYDMTGSVDEWTNDLYDLHCGSFDGAALVDPLGSNVSGLHIETGGSWVNALTRYLRSAYRNPTSPNQLSGDLGFRVVRTLEFPPAFDETCNGIDDDIDGQTDERAPCPVGNACARGRCVADAGEGFVRVEAGTFMMGSPTGEPGRANDEVLHRVTVTRPFALGRSEVTQRQWSEVMGTTPSYFSACGSDCPVESVSWNDAVDYCNALSDQNALARCYDPARILEGLDCPGFRLPTEAEWELAARGGTDTLYPGGTLLQDDCATLDPLVSLYAWYCANSLVDFPGGATIAENPGLHGTHQVGLKFANPLGLFDMQGNVWEWTTDSSDVYAVVDGPNGAVDPVSVVSEWRRARGGAWGGGGTTIHQLRSAARSSGPPDFTAYNLGFRVARTLHE